MRVGPPLTRLPSIDGWRAISILLVLGSHCKLSADFPHQYDRIFSLAFDGDLGVRCFFLISGFLITWLFLREYCNTRKVDLVAFYARRAIRIFPVYFAYLGTIALFSAATPLRQSTGAWLSNITFTTNYATVPFVTGHLWSLAVEEQFYLIWPVCLIFLLRRAGSHVIAVLLLFVIAVAASSRVFGYFMQYDVTTSPLLSAHSFFSYWDSLAIGCVTAGVIMNGGQLLTWLRRNARIAAVAGALLIAMPYVAQRLYIGGRLLVPFGPTIQAVGFAILLLYTTLFPKAVVVTPLNWRWVREIGMLSYSLYIWQMLFCSNPATLGWRHALPLTFPYWVPAVFVVAFVSYYAFERPLLKLRARFRRVPHADEDLAHPGELTSPIQS